MERAKRTHHVAVLALMLALLLCAGGASFAQVEPGEAAEGLSSEASQEFQSLANGIAFRPPAGMQRLRPPARSGDFAYFVDQNRGWVLKAGMKTPQHPLPLFKTGNRSGLVDLTLLQLKEAYPGLTVLRQDQIVLPGGPVGMLAVRYSTGMTRILGQYAILQVDERLFYVLSLTTPGVEPPEETPESADPGEAEAVAAFSDVVDSVRLLDRTFLKEDQDQRLFRTRTLFAGWDPERVRQALVREQWLRILRDGKDVGYSFIAEEPETRGNTEGIAITIRTWLRPEAGRQVETEAQLFCTADRAHETWTRQTSSVHGEQPPEMVTEVGASDRREHPVRPAEHSLSVTYVTPKGGGQPIQRQLPPFYLPQAFGHLLPRLLPTDQPKTYLFASYIPEEQEVMLRYVDVGQETSVTLDGRKVRAVPILDYVGLDGTLTRHYVSRDGKYLGSVSDESVVTILPADAAKVDEIWKGRGP